MTNKMKSIVSAILIGSVAAFTPLNLKTSHGFVPKLTNELGRQSYSTADFRLNVATSRSKALIPKKTSPPSPDTSIQRSTNPLVNFSESYQELTSKYYLKMAFLQAGVLASCADIATQSMEASVVDFGHVAAMATVASTMSGVANAIWLRQLEAAFPGKGTEEVVKKTMIHAVIIASIINSAYLAFVPLFTTYLYHDGGAFDPSIVFSGWTTDEFITLTKLEICMFIPYNAIAFNYIPPSVRPLTHAATSALFNVFVSAVTLGYFDRWVATATHLFSS